MSSIDNANPKDAAGRAKVPLHLWPATATAAGAVGFLEGELKYGRNNFRAAPVAASVYVAAAKRHLDAWLEQENVSSDTGSNHLGNALACVAILVDAGVNGSLIDDRNFVPTPGAYARHIAQLTEQVARLKKQFGHLAPKHWDARDQQPKQPAFDSNQATTFGPLPDDEAGEPTNPDDPCDCPACEVRRRIETFFPGAAVEVIFLSEDTGIAD